MVQDRKELIAEIIPGRGSRPEATCDRWSLREEKELDGPRRRRASRKLVDAVKEAESEPKAILATVDPALEILPVVH